MHRKIFVIGSINTDMVIKSDKLPVPGETVIGGSFLMNPGGKGANQAVAAAKLGATVTFIGRVGDDIFGKQAIQSFQREGINTDYISNDTENPSGVALILVDGNGENIISVASGANANLKIAEVEKVLDLIQADDIVLLQLEIPIAIVEFSITECWKKGAFIILNPAPAKTLSEDVYKYIKIITPNETEAELLTGIRVIDEDTAGQAAHKLHEKGIANVIITLGEKGAYFHNEEIQQLIPSPSVKAFDTTAAGDVFNGALAVALSENMDFGQAISFACKAASISVTRMGAQASVPLRKEIMN